MSKKRAIITIIVIVLVVAASLAVWIIKNQPQAGTRGTSQPDVSITVDPDTGEQLTTDPAIAQNESQDASSIIILGLPDVIDATNMTTEQSDALKSGLTTYATQNLKGKYSTLTIRPQDTKVDGETITSTVRLGDTDLTVAMRFVDGINSGTMQLFITDPLGTGGGDYTGPQSQLFAD